MTGQRLSGTRTAELFCTAQFLMIHCFRAIRSCYSEYISVSLKQRCGITGEKRRRLHEVYEDAWNRQ